MIVMAIRSSTTARVSRNERSAEGRWVPRTASTARANAMSVAVGMAQPASTWPDPPPRLPATAKNTRAGTTTPQAAAATGSAALAGSRRSPTTSSCLSSSPATKKKTASSPSEAHCPRVRSRCHAAGPTVRSRSAGVGVDPGRVGPHDRRDGGGQQQRTADRLGAQGARDPLRLAPRGPVEDVRARGEERCSWKASRSGAKAGRRHCSPTRLPGTPGPVYRTRTPHRARRTPPVRRPRPDPGKAGGPRSRGGRGPLAGGLSPWTRRRRTART